MNDSVWIDFEKRLRVYVRRRVNAGSVDDVLSTTLLRLVRSQDKMDRAKSPIAWMYKVASNVIIDHYRKQANERQSLADYMQETAIEEGPGEPTTSFSSLAHCLVPLIKDLPAPYAKAVMLTDINGLSQSVAAKQMGLSVSGMKSRVQRGRQKLKAALLSCCALEENRLGNIVDYSIRDDSRNCCSTQVP